jgi:hypothetical protein
MDKYETRRLRLIEILKNNCDGRIVDLAHALQKNESYVARMLYEEGKNGKKRIGEEMWEIINNKFPAPERKYDSYIDEMIKIMESTDNHCKEKILIAAKDTIYEYKKWKEYIDKRYELDHVALYAQRRAAQILPSVMENERRASVSHAHLKENSDNIEKIL